MSDEQARPAGTGPSTQEGFVPPGQAPNPDATVAVPTDRPSAPPRSPRPAGAGHTRTGGMWVGLVLSAIVLLFLLIFILQNLDPVQIHFLGAVGTLPTGVALLLAAIAGVLLVAIPGSARIVQLRRAAKKGRQAL